MALTAALTADGANAQTGTAPQDGAGQPRLLEPPKRLEPPAPARPPAPAPGPTRLTPLTPGQAPAQLSPPGAAAASPGSPPPADEGGISVGPLAPVMPGAVGTLAEDDGGLGPAMWQGTPRSVVDALLPAIPAGVRSPAMHDLARRLLLSSAAVPEGSSERHFVAMRAERLIAMGDVAAAVELLDRVGRQDRHPELDRIEAEARLLNNDTVRACDLAGNASDTLDARFWQRLLVFCQALAGQDDRAALGVSLLRETGGGDPAFYALIDALSGQEDAVVDSLSDPTPLHLAMARAAEIGLPADVTGSDSPAVLRTVAIGPNAAFETRLEAAERAAAAGSLDTEFLRRLYAEVSFSEAEQGNPLSNAETEGGSWGRALLYQTAQRETVPSAKAEAVSQALASAAEDGRYAAVARVFLPVVTALTPSQELNWFAPMAVRALVVAAAAEPARRWFAQVRTGAGYEASGRSHLHAVLPLARLAGATDQAGWSEESLIAWWRDTDEAGVGRQQAELVFVLLEGLGEPVPDAIWLDLLDGTPRESVAMPPVAVWYRLDSAAYAGRVGETVLLALVVLGEQGPQEASPLAMRKVVDSLRSVGELDAARALAVEAGLAAGL